MKTEIIESRLTGKKSPDTCEDGIVATADFVAVVDGSTSKAATQMRTDMRNGRLAMLVVSEALRLLPRDATMELCCTLLTNSILDTYHRYGADTMRLVCHPEERLTASVAVFSSHRGEVWLIGDGQCMVDGVFYDNPKPDEAAIALERSQILRRMLDRGETDVVSLQRHDVGRDRIVHKIVATCHDQNKKFAVIDGFSVATDKVRVVNVPSPSEVVLSTDGYPFLLPTLHESEAALARQLATDPLCIQHYVATKGLMAGQVSFDDRAYVRFRVIQ